MAAEVQGHRAKSQVQGQAGIHENLSHNYSNIVNIYYYNLLIIYVLFFLRPILRQAKQKILLLLPGLENVEMMDESSGPYSDAVSCFLT